MFCFSGLGEQLSYPGKEPNTQSFSDDSITFAIKTAPQLQIRKNKISALDKDEEEYVRSWEKLQGDIESLHSCYADLHALTKVCILKDPFMIYMFNF